MPENKSKSLLNSQSWRNTSQSIATAICNVSNTAYSRLHLNAIAKRVLPDHTRDALFQLFCDVRTNTPKDQVFFTRHAEALKPHTFTGWLAMLAALLYSTAGLALAAIGALGLMATVAFSSIAFMATIGVMFAMFVGTVATTLTFASLGLVAVASGAGTIAAAGYVTFNFWKLVFRQVGAVRQHAHVIGSSQNQQALPSSSQGTHGSHEASSQGTFGNPGKTPGFTPRHDGAPGESTRQATHDKLTTEPAKDPSKKDISTPDSDTRGGHGNGGSLASSAGTDRSGASGGSALGSAVSQGKSPFQSSTSSGSSTVTTGAPEFTPKQGTSDKEINDIFGNTAGSRNSQGSKPSDSQTFEGVITSSKQSGAQSGGQGGTYNGGQTGNTGDKESKAQGGKQGGGQSRGMTSAPSPARTAKAASGDFTGTNNVANDDDINDIHGQGGPHGQRGSHSNPGAGDGGAPPRAQPGTSETRDTKRPVAQSTGNNVTNDPDINDIYGKGGPHGGQSPHQGTRGSDNTSFGGFGAQDIGLQSNFRGPSGQQGPYGGSGPQGSSTMHDSNSVRGGRSAY
ncbi:hypothetical protein ABBQ38_014922 [Trebouxia sp. C0009 RCD-2024]